VIARAFYFEDADWRTKPAIEYVREFIDLIEAELVEAEQKFP
jgi:hypothetical protein